MILGNVNTNREAIIQLAVLGENKQEQGIRSVEINESEADPLVGMGLLEGFELKIQGVAGGLVTITALP